MPETYRGRIRIRCAAETCIQDALRADVVPECVSCGRAVPEIFGLDDRALLRIPHLRGHGPQAIGDAQAKGGHDAASCPPIRPEIKEKRRKKAKRGE